MAWIFVINDWSIWSPTSSTAISKRDLAPTREQIRPGTSERHRRPYQVEASGRRGGQALQRASELAYLGVIVLITMMVLTGLTMSPGVDAVFPILLNLFGGRQSARTIHWICANLIVLFVIVHVVEVFIAGVFNEVGSMITGRYRIKTGDGH